MSKQNLKRISVEEVPSFKFVVEYKTTEGTAKARFTSERHAKTFFRQQKKDGIPGKISIFEITSTGRLKQIKAR
jgi:hypothetical protein